MAGRRRVALLSNVTVDYVARRLSPAYDVSLPAGFDAWVQDALDRDSFVYESGVDAVVLLLDGTEALSWADGERERRVSSWKAGVRALAEGLGGIPLLVTLPDFRESRIRALSELTSSIELEHDWHRFLRSLSEQCKSVYELDLRDLVAEVGRSGFYSEKMWYLAAMPWSREGIDCVAREVGRALGSIFEERRKVIAVDFDNTLWGGVVGEDGVEDMVLSSHGEGQRYRDFQLRLLEMRRRGVVLVGVSKNNEDDARDAFANPEMVLSEGDFAARRVNWESKAANLREVERELNITERGFVFVDDNPAERAEVAAACQEAIVPDFPDDTTQLSRFAEELWLDYFRPASVSAEDRARTEMYRGQAARRMAERNAADVNDYLASLHMRADIHALREGELGRVSQLVSKTNQFNLTTKRYTSSEIAEMTRDSGTVVLTGSVRDDFGDSGLVAVLIATRKRTGRTRIDSFLMSCRVMGRRLEELMVGALTESLPSDEVLEAKYVATKKNAPVARLYDRLGFELANEGADEKCYRITCGDYRTDAKGIYADVSIDIRWEEAD